MSKMLQLKKVGRRWAPSQSEKRLLIIFEPANNGNKFFYG